MTDQAEWDRQYGELAYNAYWDSASGRTFDGRSMPRWDELGDVVRSHWIRAAARVAAKVLARGTLLPLRRSDVSRETSPEGDTDG